MIWFAVCSEYTSFKEGPERDEATIWTVSIDPKEQGWNTDLGHPGYGLTRMQAQFLADAANEKLRQDKK